MPRGTTPMPEVLSVEARLPLRLIAGLDDGMPTPPLALMRRVIEHVGQSLTSEGEEFDGDHSHLAAQIRRLRGQLDVLTWISAEMLAIHRPLPSPLTVTLSPDTLAWDGEVAQSADERCMVELYALEGLPMPLRLPVRVRQEAGRLICTLDQPAADLADLYEQLVFRLHRRAIASRRV
jgi:hypothetical protein